MTHRVVSKRNTLILAIALLLCAAALVSIGWAWPEPVARARLGSDWQCNKTAAFITICNRISQAVPAIDRAAIGEAERI